MHARWHGHLWMPCGDAPEVPDAKNIGASAFTRRVMQLVKMLFQPFGEGFIVAISKQPQKLRSCLRHLLAWNGIFREKTFRGGTKVGAEPGVRFGRGAIHMPGTHIGALMGRLDGMRVAIHTIQHGIESMLLQYMKILKHLVCGEAALGAELE